MRPDPFSDPGDDAQEPDSGPPAAEPTAEPLAEAEPGPSAGAGAEPAQQGLFLCLPAGSLDTGRFAQSGPAADMAPDPLLATIVDAVAGQDGAGLAGCSDDQLIGVIAAIRRLESRAAWYLLAAVAEFTARTAGEPCAAEFAADQLAAELHLSQQSAAAQMDYSRTVAGRLPATFAALHAGTIHPVHVRIIEEETAILPGTGPQDWIDRLRIQLTPIARGTCGHDHSEPGYRPSRTLQHLVKARNARCAAPGCGQPAGRCDLDHTISWDQGGLTCKCDLAPSCKR